MHMDLMTVENTAAVVEQVHIEPLLQENIIVALTEIAVMADIAYEGILQLMIPQMKLLNGLVHMVVLLTVVQMQMTHND